ncbi:MAG: cation diffusion facilitator family transporter [Chitinophagales bacterium]|nr:cation diffusion facilitator family transporter [Chitinophagales bacterium]
MSHHHHHSHHRPINASINKSFVIGIVLNALFVILEIGVGFYTNSLSLLSDAGHNLSDVGSLVISLFAFKLASIQPNTFFTYGYKKSTILATLVNAAFLFVSVGIMFWEAIGRLYHPQPIQSIPVAIVAGVGIIVNSISAFLFFKEKDKDINIRGAYLHLLADAMVSLGVVIGGIAIYFTQQFWLDAVISIVIGLIILVGTFQLLKDSVRLSLDGVPQNVRYEAVKETVKGLNGVADLHHIHVWAISTTENAMTAHLVVSNASTHEEILALKAAIKNELHHLNIHHITLEVEFERDICDGREC